MLTNSYCPPSSIVDGKIVVKSFASYLILPFPTLYLFLKHILWQFFLNIIKKVLLWISISSNVGLDIQANPSCWSSGKPKIQWRIWRIAKACIRMRIEVRCDATNIWDHFYSGDIPLFQNGWLRCWGMLLIAPQKQGIRDWSPDPLMVGT